MDGMKVLSDLDHQVRGVNNGTEEDMEQDYIGEAEDCFGTTRDYRI